MCYSMNSKAQSAQTSAYKSPPTQPPSTQTYVYAEDLRTPNLLRKAGYRIFAAARAAETASIHLVELFVAPV